MPAVLNQSSARESAGSQLPQISTAAIFRRNDCQRVATRSVLSRVASPRVWSGPTRMRIQGRHPGARETGGRDSMSPFSLKPYEDQMPGVRYRDGVLRFRSTFATAGGLFYLVWGIGFAGVGIAIATLLSVPVIFAPVILIPAVIAGTVVFVLGLRVLRCRVECEDRQILVANKWNSRTLEV